jgi:hypothetical protein
MTNGAIAKGICIPNAANPSVGTLRKNRHLRRKQSCSKHAMTNGGSAVGFSNSPGPNPYNWRHRAGFFNPHPCSPLHNGGSGGIKFPTVHATTTTGMQKACPPLQYVGDDLGVRGLGCYGGSFVGRWEFERKLHCLSGTVLTVPDGSQQIFRSL